MLRNKVLQNQKVLGTSEIAKQFLSVSGHVKNLGEIFKHMALTLPKDSFPHKSVIEWWYFNGHLKDNKGRRYAFMNCLFKADPKKTSIPLVENIPAKEVYFSHSVFSDLNRKRVTTRTHPLSIISKDSFTKKLFFVNYIHPSLSGYVNAEIIELKPGTFKVKNEDIDLILTARKKPFLHNGKGCFNVRKKKVFYYSYTNMKAEGTILNNGKPIEVKGKAWMDHEWAGFAGEKNWDWFSIQLDNGTEMMVQDYNNREKVYIGINPKSQKGEFTDAEKPKVSGMTGTIGVPHHDLVLIPKKEWKSPLTGAKYPVEWRIIVSSKHVDLEVSAPIKNQEVLFGSLNYWEGPIEVSGTIEGKKVRGQGFMELTGRKMEKSKIKVYEQQLKKEAEYYLDFARKEVMNYWKNRGK